MYDAKPSIREDVTRLAEIVARLDHLSLADADGSTRATFFAAMRNAEQLSLALSAELDFRESVGAPLPLGGIPAESHVYRVTNPDILDEDDEIYSRRFDRSPRVIASRHEPYRRNGMPQRRRDRSRLTSVPSYTDTDGNHHSS